MTTKRKYIVLLGDGMADEPIEILGGKTPLEAARTPAMDFLAQNGLAGWVHTVPPGLSPGSDVANMGILGYDPRIYYTGRGPIEAAAMGIEVPKGMMVFRCNLCQIEDGKMKDFTADHVSNEAGAKLLGELNAHFAGRKVKFFPGVSYRNIVLLDENWADVKTTAPHDITGKSIENYLPSGPAQAPIRAFVEECAAVLARHRHPANFIWPWSQGKIPKLPPFEKKYGFGGGIVTAVDLLKGLATLSGLSAPNVEGATGFLDTNYAGKVAAGLDILRSEPFAFIHIEAPDEAGHMGDANLKKQAIEDFDAKVVAPVLEYQKAHPETRILVLPDHPTPCRLKTHSHAPVPFVMFGAGIEKDPSPAYNERAVSRTKKTFEFPWEMMGEFLTAI